MRPISQYPDAESIAFGAVFEGEGSIGTTRRLSVIMPSRQELLANLTNIVKYHDMNRETFIARLTEVQQIVEQLLSQLQASEHDAFAAHLYRSRREFRSRCERAGKSGKAIERCAISTFRVAESMGFKGELRQWEELLRIGD